MKIWLDDLRTPPDEGWEWCKNSYEFVAAIRYPPAIEHVAFDHDLGELSENGSWCARKLAEKCLEYLCCPGYSCQSDNPPGRENILSIMRSLERLTREEEQE